MSFIDGMINGAFSLVGSILGVGVFPYVRSFLDGGEKLVCKLEENLYDIEELKMSLLNRSTISFYENDGQGCKDKDIEYCKELYVKLVGIVLLILRDRYKLKSNVFVGYENFVNYFLEKLNRNCEEHSEHYNYVIRDFLNGDYDSSAELNLYKDYIVMQGNLASESLKKIYEAREEFRYKKSLKKIMKIFH